jgi:hypothetical protein
VQVERVGLKNREKRNMRRETGGERKNIYERRHTKRDIVREHVCMCVRVCVCVCALQYGYVCFSEMESV